LEEGAAVEADAGLHRDWVVFAKLVLATVLVWVDGSGLAHMKVLPLHRQVVEKVVVVSQQQKHPTAALAHWVQIQ